MKTKPMEWMREIYRLMDDEYYEAISDWCELNHKLIEGKRAIDLYGALMQILSLECSPQVEEFWHKVAMNYHIDPDELEYQSNPCNDKSNLPKLFKEFPYGKTYMPCIEELYHKYEMELDELLSELQIIKHIEGKGYSAVCPICGAGKEKDANAFLMIIPHKFSATCLGSGCKMNRRELTLNDESIAIRNTCHTSYLFTKLKGIFTNPTSIMDVVNSPKLN